MHLRVSDAIVRVVSTARRLHYSYEAYLRALEISSIKLEYLDGEIFAMAGGTPTHAQLAARIIHLLTTELPGSCSIFTSDLKIRIDATDLSTFPDVTVVCGTKEGSPIDPNAITNPTLLIEVTSRSTEDYDRGEKLRHFKHLPSLRAVLFVSHRRAQVTIVERAETDWTEREANAGEVAVVEHPELRLSISDLYRGIELEV